MTHDSQTKTTVTRHTGEPYVYYGGHECTEFYDKNDMLVFRTTRPLPDWLSKHIVESSKACASIQGDPGEGIRKAIEAMQSTLEEAGVANESAWVGGAESKPEALVRVRLSTVLDLAAALSALKGGEV